MWQSSFFHPLLYSSVCQGYPVFCFEDDEGDLIADTYLTEGTSWFLDPFAENFITHTMPLQETCVEILVRYPDDWGNIPNTFSFYNCMGRCGSNCVGAWAGGWDCLKHDVCSSYFKGLAMETPVVGFCRGFDFGDETAQSVANCWSRSSSGTSTNDEDIRTPVVCSSDSDMVLNPAAGTTSRSKTSLYIENQVGTKSRNALGKR